MNKGVEGGASDDLHNCSLRIVGGLTWCGTKETSTHWIPKFHNYSSNPRSNWEFFMLVTNLMAKLSWVLALGLSMRRSRESWGAPLRPWLSLHTGGMFSGTARSISLQRQLCPAPAFQFHDCGELSGHIEVLSGHKVCEIFFILCLFTSFHKLPHT